MSMTTPETAPVEVTQAAREAVAVQVETAFYVGCEYAQELRQGLHDSDPNLQHFARFEADILARRQDGLREADIALLGARMVLEGKTTNATGALAKSDWKPSRAHIEGMRNTMREAIEYIDEARAALSDTSPLANDTGALRDIAAERARQVSVEGWTPEHDDEHGDGSLAAAAATYAFSAATADKFLAHDPMGFWPWDAKWWKPSDPRRDLVKAGALIVAEIERIDRLAALSPDDGEV